MPWLILAQASINPLAMIHAIITTIKVGRNVIDKGLLLHKSGSSRHIAK